MASGPATWVILIFTVVCLGMILGAAVDPPKEDKKDEVSSKLRENVRFWGALGITWKKVWEQVQNRTIDLYMSELNGKVECKWKEESRDKWEKKWRHLKKDAGEDEDDYDDFFELGKIKEKKPQLTELAKWTVEVLEDIQNLINSYADSQSTILTVKFGSSLREKMIFRQQKFPGCDWTDDDRKRTDKNLDEIIDFMSMELQKGITDILKVKKEDIFTDDDKGDWDKEMDKIKADFKIFFRQFDPEED